MYERYIKRLLDIILSTGRHDYFGYPNGYCGALDQN